MSNVVTLQGTLLAGPSKSSTAGSFPSALVNAEFELKPPNKAAARSFYGSPNVNSPAAFVELPGVGASPQTVTQGSFLYVRTSGKMLIRITMVGEAGDLVSTLEVDGLYIQEFPAANYCKLLEAQGVGAIEYFVSGSQ